MSSHNERGSPSGWNWKDAAPFALGVAVVVVGLSSTTAFGETDALRFFLTVAFWCALNVGVCAVAHKLLSRRITSSALRCAVFNLPAFALISLMACSTTRERSPSKAFERSCGVPLPSYSTVVRQAGKKWPDGSFRVFEVVMPPERRSDFRIVLGAETSMDQEQAEHLAALAGEHGKVMVELSSPVVAFRASKGGLQVVLLDGASSNTVYVIVRY